MEQTKEWTLVLAAHHVMCRMLRSPRAQMDELIFLDFRPHWLKPQQRVYSAMPVQQCEICMYEFFPEHIARQHIPNHPPVCSQCYARMQKCPFCRVYIIKPKALTLAR